VVATSKRWTFKLDLEDVSLHPTNWGDVIRLTSGAECGTVSAAGQDGDWLDLEFNQSNAALWYMTEERTILRPFFPNRSEAEQAIDEFFCKCCGVQLGPKEELLRRCMKRIEAFNLSREILHRCQLALCIPEERFDQPRLPGMEKLAEFEAKWRVVEWRLFKTIGSKLA
jgi:hypothetical protein